MGVQYTDKIGTGQTYTTPVAWRNARNLEEIWTGDRIGECLAEEFTSNYAFLANGTYSKPRDINPTGVNLFLVTAEDGAQHDGRAHIVSGAGNARFHGNERYISSNPGARWSGWYGMSWLEARHTDTSTPIFYDDYGNQCLIHHNIMWASGVADRFLQQNNGTRAGADAIWYRNIIYGHTDQALNWQIASTPICNYNTLWWNGASQMDASTNNAVVGKANAVFESSDGGICIASNVDDEDNMTSDTSGGDSTTRTASGNFTDPTTDWPNTDLTIFGDSADLYQATTVSMDSLGKDRYPDEWDVPISDRSATISGPNYSIGADDIADAPEPTATYQYFQAKQYGRYYGMGYAQAF